MIDEENQLGGAENPAVDPSDAPSADASVSGSTLDGNPALGTQSDGSIEDASSSHADGVDLSSTEIGAGEPADAIDYAAVLLERENEIKALKAQVDERTNQCVRIAADFDNYRKRTQREREELEQQIKCSTINELLPVVDNFERARSQIKPQTDAETTIHKSYQSVYKQLVECLKRIGVAPMRSEGKEFDPTMHEAVMRQPTSEQPEGTVMEELQRGYMLGDRVLRHALVKVAAAPDPTMDSEVLESGQPEG